MRVPVSGEVWPSRNDRGVEAKVVKVNGTEVQYFRRDPGCVNFTGLPLASFLESYVPPTDQ